MPLFVVFVVFVVLASTTIYQGPGSRYDSNLDTVRFLAHIHTHRQ